MKVAVSGGTGFIGRGVVQRFLDRGDEVLVVSRNPEKVRAGRGVGWDAIGEIASADVVLNFAGENIGGGRWTAERKRRILESRLRATDALVSAMESDRRRPRTFISASAVGFYGLRGDEVLDEASGGGAGR